jgi:hypothetical protein
MAPARPSRAVGGLERIDLLAESIRDIKVVPAVRPAGPARQIDRKLTSQFATYDRLRFEMTVTADAGLRINAATSAPVSASLATAVGNLFLVAFCEKISPNDGAITLADAAVIERLDRGLA